MPILDWEPGTSPEADGTLRFYRQGAGEDSGFRVTARGVMATFGTLRVGGVIELGQNGDTNLYRNGANSLRTDDAFTVGGSLTVSDVAVTTGEDASAGVATLVAGTVTVTTAVVTADSMIFLTSQVDGGTPGWVRVSDRAAGTGFTITSSSASDTSVVAYWIVEPAA